MWRVIQFHWWHVNGRKETHTWHFPTTTKSILPFCTNTSWYRITDFGTLGVILGTCEPLARFPCAVIFLNGLPWFELNSTDIGKKEIFFFFGHMYSLSDQKCMDIQGAEVGCLIHFLCFNAFVILVVRWVGSIYKWIDTYSLVSMK